MKKTEREEYLYHNTEKLLKKYRDYSAPSYPPKSTENLTEIIP